MTLDCGCLYMGNVVAPGLQCSLRTPKVKGLKIEGVANTTNIYVAAIMPSIGWKDAFHAPRVYDLGTGKVVEG